MSMTIDVNAVKKKSFYKFINFKWLQLDSNKNG